MFCGNCQCCQQQVLLDRYKSGCSFIFKFAYLESLKKSKLLVYIPTYIESLKKKICVSRNFMVLANQTVTFLPVKPLYSVNSLTCISIFSIYFQHCIFMCVSDFGPLPCSIVTTTRKFFTVLFSVLFFGNALTSRQWMGTGLVFSGLFLDAAFGKSKISGK